MKRKRISDREIVEQQMYWNEEIRIGTYPVQDAIRNQCVLLVEWTRRQRITQGGISPAWEKREKDARQIVRVLNQGRRAASKGDPVAATHCAVTAGGMYFGLHPDDVLADLRQKLEQLVAKELERDKASQKGGKGKLGKEGKLKRTLRALYDTMDPCDLRHLMPELEADARGSECALTGLREQGRVFIKPLEVTADGMDYDELGGKSNKRVSAKRLNDILSELRKE
ncbi:MAG TPA: hypothetical protein DCP75_08205 [Haliea salexigens]|uniref:Uncharacterized protein n=1 Tax=Haliea salexigens TaxID=287487 RepID=A0A3C1KMK2_9GAMM|nr:hypothetical protein [Haliea sp.]HAN27688.1 hypothetical protein [Haliea salexigens]|tara:strand:- start:1087 stop:1764 length:678 start_codon:yes stop_codon:yes gene_type:complete